MGINFDESWGNQKDFIAFAVGSGACMMGANLIENVPLELQNSIYAIDADEKVLSQFPTPQKFLIGRKVFNGEGTGGDAQLASICFEEDIPEIKELLAERRCAIIMSLLGGGCGSGISYRLGKLTRDLGILTICVFGTPPSCDLKPIIDRAKYFIDKVEDFSHLTFFFNGKDIENIFKDNEDIAHNELMECLKKLIVERVATLMEIISRRGIENLGFRDLRNAFSVGGKGILSQAVSYEEECADKLLNAIIQDPMMKNLHYSNAEYIVGLLSGHHIRKNEVQKITMEVWELCKGNAVIRLGYKTSKDYEEGIKLVLIATGKNLDKDKIVTPRRNPYYYDFFPVDSPKVVKL